MNAAGNIGLWQLAMGFLILLIPAAFLLYYRIKLIKPMLISALRMVLQLSLVAVYLEWVFEKNNAWLNSLWVLIMISVGVLTTIRRVSLNWKQFVFPFFIAGFTSVLIVDAFFIGAIIRLDNVFDAQYFIPITGMILGNALKHNIVGLNTYFKELSEKSNLFHFLLTNTANLKISHRPFVAEAVKQALNPLIASMSVIGLISLPGMMTGQLLGGSSPAVAIKYQIMIMLAIFAGCTINLFTSIIITRRFVFDDYQNIKTDRIFARHKQHKLPKSKSKAN